MEFGYPMLLTEFNVEIGRYIVEINKTPKSCEMARRLWQADLRSHRFHMYVLTCFIPTSEMLRVSQKTEKYSVK